MIAYWFRSLFGHGFTDQDRIRSLPMCMGGTGVQIFR